MLPDLSQATGSVNLESDGAGSQLDMSGLTSFDLPSGSLTVTDDANAGFPRLTSLVNLNVALDATATVSMSQVTTLTGSLNLTGGPLDLPGLTDADSSTINVTGGSTLSLPPPTAFTGASAVVMVSGSGSSLAIGSGILNPLPTSGTGVVINVPQFPQGMDLNLNPNGTFFGGTTFNVDAEATVNIVSGTYTGGGAFNIAQGATLDLTGGQSVTYSGNFTGSGAGTVTFSGGYVIMGVGGATFNFPGNMFQ